MVGTHAAVFPHPERQNTAAKREAEVLFLETLLLRRKTGRVKRAFLNTFSKHEEATCQWRRLHSAFQCSQEMFTAVFHTPGGYNPVLSMVATPSGKEVRSCPTRVAWALLLPYLLPCR